MLIEAKDFADAVNDLRVQRKMTKRDLLAKAGVDTKTLRAGSIEAMSTETLSNLLAVLGCSMYNYAKLVDKHAEKKNRKQLEEYTTCPSK